LFVHVQTHLEADVLPLSITIQPQDEPLTLASQLLQVLLEVIFVLQQPTFEG
jgi:hypothetical protein